MRSKVHFKSHPVHPMLVAFPIAFYLGTFTFDILGTFYKERFLTTALHLNIAAVLSAVITAVPGFLDFLHTVPPKSSAKKRAAQHGILNTLVLLVFVVTLYLKYNDPEKQLIISLELLGVIGVSVAGFLGGTLVFRNQIGVDIRYADAGKWKEDYLSEKHGKVRVGNKNELKQGQMKLVHVNEKRIVLAHGENGFAAFDDRCNHKGGSLAAGALVCDTVQCPWHGSQFNIYSGDVKAGPAKDSLPLYQLFEEDDDFYLDVDEVHDFIEQIKKH